MGKTQRVLKLYREVKNILDGFISFGRRLKSERRVDKYWEEQLILQEFNRVWRKARQAVGEYSASVEFNN